MRRWIMAALGLVIAGALIAYFMISPPKLLSLLDGAIGAGSGTERVATAVPFGTHGQIGRASCRERVCSTV